MLYIYYFVKKNKLSHLKLANILNICKTGFEAKLYAKNDFTIDELEKLKEYFVKLGLLSNDFDIGDFLNFVAEQ